MANGGSGTKEALEALSQSREADLLAKQFQREEEQRQRALQEELRKEEAAFAKKERQRQREEEAARKQAMKERKQRERQRGQRRTAQDAREEALALRPDDTREGGKDPSQALALTPIGWAVGGLALGGIGASFLGWKMPAAWAAGGAALGFGVGTVMDNSDG